MCSLDSREVNAEEAKSLSLVNYLVRRIDGGADAAFQKSLEVAILIASHPQRCMRNDRLSMLNNAYGQSKKQLMQDEFACGLDTLDDPSFGMAVQAFVNKPKLSRETAWLIDNYFNIYGLQPYAVSLITAT